ncbi:SRPBCC domain-containing protein [Leifsonia sp. NPDC058230]|uniref:SRPBCC family protein n=1 Tax=Leifsonia sp. NPDC058230 TaxID=3346391 RepID=UPI0036D95810
MTPTTETDRGFTLTRILDAPRALVFQAWTDPAHLGWFFSGMQPAGEPIEVDLRVGGAWRQRMVVAEDTEYMTGGIYREIVPVERLVFEWGAEGGWPSIDPAHPDGTPVVTVLLTEAGESGEKTEMVFRVDIPGSMSGEAAQEWLATGMHDGWGMTIDRLVAAFARD